MTENERLTHEHAQGWYSSTGKPASRYWTNATKTQLVDRLAAYEDTGMSPEEILPQAPGTLSAHAPRVVAFEEIDNYEVLWLEVRDVQTEGGLAPWVKTKSGRWFSPLLCSDARPDMILSTPEEYGRICRCWTSRPTDAQRNAEPWDKEADDHA